MMERKIKKVDVEPIQSLIQRRRLQLLVHSAIYYHFNENIITDAQWTEWAKELIELQKEYPEIADKTIYADAFRDFDPSTGYNLPFSDPHIQKTAIALLNMYHSST